MKQLSIIKWLASIAGAAALGLALFIAFFVGILIFGAFTAKWEIARRQSVGAELERLRKAVIAEPTSAAAQSNLAASTDAEDGWDRVAAYVEIRQCAPAIIGDPEAHTVFTVHLLPALRRGVLDDDPYVRREAAQAACEYGDLVAPIADTLLAAAHDHPNQDCGWYAVRALGNLGTDDEELIKSLESLRRHNDMIAEEVDRAVEKLRSAEVLGAAE